ncbi:polyprenyl synthetase family protein [Lactovum miscens]|uniref:Heptaprenyl diphosphate synthase n=1 Tax=Lactovum miscens TaxID=190387 RepID=A0A841C782_9LACT|nr:polyprenyl synthetase family protein [Lactovum miscens]MBB5887452.1 heptaprenyl diphosphate synthase [Lactovum miscens]
MIQFWKEFREIESLLEQVQSEMKSRLYINNNEISAALQDFSTQGGKMVRPALFFLFAGMGETVTLQDKVKIASSIELLHLATLIHDDIIDDSPTRRNLPTLQKQLGKDTAVYAGDFVYTVYFELLTETMNGSALLSQNAKSMKKVLMGELIQKDLAYNTDVKIYDYLRAISGKTAELLCMSCYQGAYFGGLNRSSQKLARRIGRNVGLAFQIYDDILNFSVDLKNEKPILSDVQQGIFTLPLILARDHSPEKIIPYLQRASFLKLTDLYHLAELVKKTGALENALKLAERLTSKALKDISHLPNGTNKNILIEATQKLLKRDY